MSLVACMQVYCRQYSVSLFCILWRCLLIGMCPVRSWVSKLACLQLSELVISRNLSEGNDWSICLSFLNLGDLFHHSFIDSLILELIACLIAEILMGSWL